MPFSTYLPEHMGSIRLAPPGPFVAGSHAELTLTYTAGTFGIDDTGMVKVSWRTTSDMSKPQFDKPAAPNFTTVEASNGAKLEVWFDRLNIRPYANTLLIRVGRGYLRAGDTLTIRFGDRRQGSPGFRLQTNCEERVELKTSIDAFATYEFTELPEQPAFALVPGAAASWKAIWPSLAVVGEPFRLAILAEDMWGNPTTQVDQALSLVPSRPVRGLPERIMLKPGDGPSPERRAKSWFNVRFVGRGGGKQVVTEVAGGDPGYDETAKMLGESALCLALDDLPETAGQTTTAAAMGPALRERLVKAGMAFATLSTDVY